MNEKKVSPVFVAATESVFDDLSHSPRSRFSIRVMIQGIRDGLGEKSQAKIVKEISFEYSAPEGLDAQITALRDSGADVQPEPFAWPTTSVDARCSSSPIHLFRSPPAWIWNRHASCRDQSHHSMARIGSRRGE